MPESKPSKVLYLQVRNLDYPRNFRIRAFFSNAGFEVTTQEAEKSLGGVRNFVVNSARMLRWSGDWDVVVLSEFSLKYALVSALVARRARAVHIVDGFVGLYESEIEDRKKSTERSFRARVLRLIDLVALKSADIFIIDTEVRAAALRPLVKRRGRVVSLPVGAPAWAVPPASVRQPDGVLRVLYYGNYIPLHGVEYAIAAVERMGADEKVAMTLLGDAELGHRSLAHVSPHTRSRFTIVPPMPEADLKQIIDAHDVILGIFGTSPKAATVIANKVWQGLASGKPVITRSSSALVEISDIVGPQLLQVQAADVDGIVDALRATGTGTGLRLWGATAELLESYTAAQFELFRIELSGRIESIRLSGSR